MSRRFVVIHEAPADFVTATELADRVLVERVDWLDASLLDSQRIWVGDEPDGARLSWKSIPARAREAGIRVRGHFRDEPGLPDARAARRAIAYVLHRLNDVSAIVFIRDSDDQDERREGLEQARATYAARCAIVIGLAIRERECWVVSGFDPASDDESQRLRNECATLGFNPCLHSERLTATKKDAAKRSPKRVLAALTFRDRDRERACWLSAPLDTLRARGQGNGLAAYLADVASRLVPVITGR